MLVENGASVIGVSRKKSDDFPGIDCSDRYRALQCDLCDFDSLERDIRGILVDIQRLDGVINCHGVGDFGSLETFSRERVHRLVDTNLTSVVLLSRLVLPAMKKNNVGDLVFIGSESALSGGKKGAVYCATKFGLRGLAQALRLECAASGIRVSIVNPGPVNTEFFDPLDFAPGESRDNYLEAEDVANAIKGIIAMPAGSVIDEVNLSPQKKVIRGKEPELPS
jgi:short-subunit dehydrogenase